MSEADLPAMNTETSIVADYLADIVKPGHGYAEGCTIARRSEGERKGVAFTRVTLVEPNGNRESLYLTESGHRVEPSAGTYGDSTRWAVYGPGITGSFVSSSIAYVVNLDDAFTMIARHQ